MLLLNAIIHTDPEQTVLQRIGDQAFSVVVLVGIAWILWKRQIKLEDRLTQYLDDDREKMLGVIENNTKVMERLEDALSRSSPR
ncbi:hypothetical protein [Chitinophaga pinensis]|uniref:Uncharacterized protein n=1 Tax=Chitinophaga pinensis (strain ATCC 43595 / DSM 2588 / LMG 13176 / NBRC 15968 / NCIMB 11800 / UQM 2034) TaxID=485918 RepID=A0A979FZ40_CHIPD|nr:hypothetical protein [Chitinophaga pinensis]ACU57780.1 hypothetical protein Cpin_0281 [Chitinophaga pinensis DSM 2588]